MRSRTGHQAYKRVLNHVLLRTRENDQKKMKGRNEKRKKPQNDLSIKVFTGIYTLCFTRKIYRTIKVINTRKYASLGGRKIFHRRKEDFSQEALNQKLIN